MPDNLNVSNGRYRLILLAVLCLVCACAHVCSAQQGRRLLGPPIRDDERTFRKYVTSWTGLKKQNVVMQQRDFSCGAAAMATLMRYHWGDKQISEGRLLHETVVMLTPEEMKDRIKNGLTLTDLRRLAVRVGYNASIGELTFDNLAESKVPVIVGIVVNEYDHFVVYRGTDWQYVYLADPSRGKLRVPIAEFQKQWQENLVLVIVPRSGDLQRASPLLVNCDEMFLGEVNRLYLRDRMTDIGPAE